MYLYPPAHRETQRDVIETRRKKSVFALKKRQLSLNEPRFKVAFIFFFISIIEKLSYPLFALADNA